MGHSVCRPPMLQKLFRLVALLILGTSLAHAEIVVRDDAGNTVRLKEPARRIVSLSPHVTETLYAAGAGDHLVGAVEYSDYPPAAKQLPRIGGSARLDLEVIAALKPDLAIGWDGGNSTAHLAKLRSLGIPVYLVAPEHIEDVAAALERYGELAGTQDSAHRAADAFRERIRQLRQRYQARATVRTFYQIWNEPLMTVGGTQVISDAIRLCGGENVFGALAPLAATVSVEAVLAADPEAIIASGADDSRPAWLDDWRRWRNLTAVKRDNLFFLPPDLIQRHTPRLVEGVARLCAQLEAARQRRGR